MPGEEKHRAGLSLLEEGRAGEAVCLLEQALSEEPTSERWNDWAAAEMSCGHTDKAEQGFRGALALNGHDGQAAANLGILLASLGREQEAVPFLQQALEHIDEPQRIMVKEVLAHCSRKVAAEALTQSQAAFRNLTSELRQSLSPAPLPSDPAAASVARPLPLWDDNPEFNRISQKMAYSAVDIARCYILYQFAKEAAELAGDVAEVGVYKGGSARIIAQTIAPRALKIVHLFDTFAGMPATDASIDHHHAGDFADTSLQAVQRDLRDCENVRFHQGFFPDTAAPVKDQRFCMVHVDVDIRSSVRDCCMFFYPRMERGGIMVFDDYGFNSCPGARKAVDEFFADKPERPFYLPTGQCFVVRK